MKTSRNLERREDSGVAQPSEDRPVFVPATDIYEKQDALLIRCDMPGVDEQNVEVTLKENTLTIIGSQSDDRREGYQRLLGEYRTGIFRRAFTIRQPVDQSAITARLKNGVLEIMLPKAKEALPRKIQIET